MAFTSHGHIIPGLIHLNENWDGPKVKCRGPGACSVCTYDSIVAQQKAVQNGTSINSIREGMGFPPYPEETHDDETMTKVFNALLETGMSGDKIMNCIRSLQNAGILFRERK